MINKVTKAVFYLSIIGVFAFMAASPEANAATTDLIKTLTATNSKLVPGITTGFALFAAVKWISYFAGFSTANALTDAITPAVLTFLTFKWEAVLQTLMP